MQPYFCMNNICSHHSSASALIFSKSDNVDCVCNYVCECDYLFLDLTHVCWRQNVWAPSFGRVQTDDGLALGLALFPTLSVHPSSVFFSLGSSNAHAGCSKQALLLHLSFGWSLGADSNVCGPVSLFITVQRVCCIAGVPSLQGGFGLAWVGFLGQECEGISSSRGQRLGYASLPPTELFPFKNTPQETTSNNHIPHRERSAPLLELGKTSPFPS